MKLNNIVLDRLAWIAFAVVVIYFLLKIIGVIHSPITIDLIALLSGAYFVGRYAMKIDTALESITHMREDFRVLDKNCKLFKKKGTKTR